MSLPRDRLKPEVTAAPPPPPPDSSAGDETEGRTVAVLKQIQAGSLDPKCLGVADRRLLVVNLMADGYSTAEIAQVLKVSDRSIERDKKAIRESHALSKDPRLVELMVGRLVSEAELSVQRIRKAARDKLSPAATKVDAERSCYQIISDLVQSLQRLGYLPLASQRVQADLTHHLGEVPGFDDLQVEVQRMKQITAQPDGTVPAELLQLEEQLTRADLAARVAQLATDVESVADSPGEDHDRDP